MFPISFSSDFLAGRWWCVRGRACPRLSTIEGRDGGKDSENSDSFHAAPRIYGDLGNCLLPAAPCEKGFLLSFPLALLFFT